MTTTITGSSGNQSLTGPAGGDLFILKVSGGDTIVGGAGANTVAYSGTESQYTVFSDGSGGYYVETNAFGPTPSLLDHLTNIQTLQFSDQSAAASSLAGGLVIQAGAGALTLNGTSGADILVSGTGVDTLNGNGGADVFYISNASDIINETVGSGAIVYVSAPHWYANAAAGVAKVIATGTGAINLTGNGYAMILAANNGIDTLSDNGVADTLIGGTGIDSFVVANAATVVQAASGGNNTIKTSLASYTLPANVQNLTYTGTGAFQGVGGSLAGTLTGGVGNDTLISGTGVETLIGGGGTDTFYVNNAADAVTATAGGRSVEFTSVSGVKAAANVVALTYTGTGAFVGTANATGTFLTGGSGANTLNGGAGHDTLIGGASNDVIYNGGGGGDSINGGGGTNKLVYTGKSTGYTTYSDGSGGYYVETNSFGLAVGLFDHVVNIQTLQFSDKSLTASTATIGTVIFTGVGPASVSATSGTNVFVDGGGGGISISGGAGANTVVYAGTKAQYAVFSDGTGGYYVETTALGAGQSLLDHLTNVQTLQFSDQQTTAATMSQGLALFGAAGSASLLGAAGNDLIYGAANADTIDGGAGTNTVVYAGAASQYVVYADGAGGYYVENLSRPAIGQYDHLVNIQTLQFFNQAGSPASLAVGQLLKAPSGAASLVGTAGNDLLVAGGGDDAIDGGGGVDTVYLPGPQSRYVVYSDGGAGYYVQDETASGPTGLDHLINVQSLQFSTGTVSVASALAAINGQTLQGGPGADTLIGGAGNDLILGGGGGDSIDGGGGVNMAAYGSASSQYAVYGNGKGGYYVGLAGASTFDQLTNVQLLRFSDGVFSPQALTIGQLLTGSAGATLSSGAGADIIFAIGGSESIDGGAGANTVIYSGASTAYTVYSDGGTGVYVETNAAGANPQQFDHLVNIQTLQFADVSVSPSSLVVGKVLFGTANADTLVGASGNDLIVGREGGDLIDGAGGVNTVVYAGPQSQYTVYTDGSGGYEVRDLATGAQNLTFDHLLNIQYLQFSNTTASVSSLATGQVIWAPTGATSLTGTSGNDLLVLSAGYETIDGAGGADTAVLAGPQARYRVWTDGAGGYYVLDATAGAANQGLDHLINVQSLQFADVTVSAASAAIGTAQIEPAGAATLTGGPGADLFISQAAGDLIQGGGGVDTVVYGGAASQYVVTADGSGGYYVASAASPGAADHLVNIQWLEFANGLFAPASIAAGATLYAPSAGGLVLGGGGPDTLIGGAGNDTLVGGGGNASLDGGAGVNTAVFAGNQAQYAITPDGVGGFYVKDNRTGFSDLEHLTNIQFVQFADQTSAPSAIAVGANLTATAAITTLQGSGGNDTLNGGPSADTLIGGGGNDTFYVNNAADVVVAAVGSGVDTVYVSAASWVVTPGAGIQHVIGQSAAGVSLTGNAYAMELDGAAGNDTLSDGGAADTLVGGAGNDTYVVANPGTVVVEALNGGFDTINTSLSSYTLPANVEALTYTGSGNFYGVGNNLNDIITGGAGYNTLVGGTGLDTFYIKSANTQIIVANPNPGDMVVSGATVFNLPANINILKLLYAGAVGVANNNNDTISGSAGGEIFVAGTGNDVFNPIGAGDIFVYNVPIGNDVINNFLTASDAVRLGGYGLSTLAQVQALMTQQGSNVVLQLAANSSITFTNTTLSAFTAANFQLQLNTSNLTPTFDDEFNTLSVSNGQTGTWSTTFGFAGANTLTTRTLPGNGEQELYVDPNYAGVNGSTPLGLNPFSITGGVLSITAQATPAADLSLLQNLPYTSGLLTTQPSFAQTYGYYEIKAQLPSGQGAWPAFWLLPVSGLNPPEIDVLEANAANPNGIFETVHDLNLPTAKSGIANYLAGATTGFHTYGLMWDPTHITWYIDGTQVYQIATPADMNQPMYMLLDLAVGGGFGGTVNPNTLSASGFQIDYVRAYAINGVTIAEQVPTAPVQSTTSGLAATTPYNDTVIGGAGFTEQFGHYAEINGGNGFDTVVYSGTRSQYSVYNDSMGGYYVVNNAAPLSQGADHLVSIEAIQFADGTYAPASIAANDYIVSSGAPEVISGYSGNNFLFAFARNSTVIAGSGADTVVANNGGDIIYGGGNTTAVFSNPHQNYTIYQDGNGGFYVVDHTVGSPVNGVTDVVNVQYLSFSDYTLPTLVAWQSIRLAATAPNQLVTGNIGYDTFVGGLGGDTLAGGSGLNTALFTGQAAQYLVYAGANGGYYVEYPGTVGGAAPVFDDLINIQSLQFSDGVQNAANLVSGQYLQAGAGLATLTGGAGNDWIVGAAGQATIDGGAGVNTVQFSGAQSNYIVYSDGAGGFYVVDTVVDTPTNQTATGLEHIVNIQTLQFTDVAVAPTANATGSVIQAPTAPSAVVATPGDDLIFDGGLGGETIDGAGGSNTLVYGGFEAQYTVYADGAGGFYVETNALGALDHIVNIQRLDFGDQTAAPSALSVGSVLIAAPGPGSLTGGVGNDILVDGGGGGEALDGGAGTNILDYAGLESQYTLYADGAGGYYVETNALGTAPSLLDHIVNIQTLQFADQAATPAALVTGSVLTAAAGAVSLTGTAGNDIIIDGGGGGDSINGGGGKDTLVYAGTRSQYSVYADGSGGYYVETNNLGASPSLLDHIANIQTLQFADQSASPGALATGSLLAVPTGPASLTGTAGNDVIIDSGGGADTIDGGNGTDTLVYAGTRSQYTVYADGTGGYDVETNALGTSPRLLDHIVNIQTLQFADQSATPTSLTVGSVLTVPTGSASLTGTAGNDIIIDSGGGGDSINGAAGYDTLVYSGTRSQYTVYADGAGGYYVETNALGTTPSLLDHVVNIQILQFADQSATPASLSVGSVLTVPTGPASLIGTAGNDIIIDSGGGGDSLNGGGGSDILVYAGTRSQYTVYADGTGGYYVATNALGTAPSLLDHIVNIQTLQFSDQSAAPASISIGTLLTVSPGPASLTGTSGNDIIIDSGGGGDSINGGGGSDVLVYSGNRSQYTVYADGTGGYYVETNALGTAPSLLDHIVNIQTLQFADQSATPASAAVGTLLTVPTGPASLTGTTGNDIIINGGGGGDSLSGGGGSDTLVYAGTRSQYSVYADGSGGYDVETNALGASPSRLDHIVNIQTLQFADQSASPASLTVGSVLTVPTGPASLTGTAGSDIIINSGGGGDSVNGGGGSDTLVYSGARSQYTVYADGSGGYYVETNALGTTPSRLDHIVNIQTLQFADQSATAASLTVGSVLKAATGPASLTGTAGNDIIINAGGGGDTLNGGGGSDVLVYSGTRSQYTVYADGAGGYYVETNALGTTPSRLDHIVNIQTLQFSDQSASPASLAVGSVLSVPTGPASLTGTTGNDIIINGGGGGDSLNGGGGSDVVVYSGTRSQYTVYADGSGGYYVETNALGTAPSRLDHIVNIQTLQFADQSASPASLTVGSVLKTAAGPASLTGTSGNDIIINSGGGGDSLNGGGGSDVLVYSGTRSQYTVFADGSGGYYVETNALGPTPSLLDHLTNIQTLQFSDRSAAISSLVGGSVIQAGAGAVTLNGTTGADILVSGTGVDTLNGNGGADVFYVNNASDIINEAYGSGAVVYLSAGHWYANATAGVAKVIATGTAAINLTGNGYAMTLVANNGIDTLSDNGVADTLIGGTGMDTFLVANAATVVQALNAGNNTVKTSLASYTLPANVQNLTYTGTGAFYGVGGALAGTLTGGVGNDTLVSGTGAEALNGGGGTDTFYVNNAADTVTASVGSHSVEFTSVASLKAAANIVALTYTGTGNFTGYANATGTFITGGHGNDFLDGGAGADTLDGGGGNDTLIAGTGADQFRFDAPGLGVDQISGFVSGTDHIALAGSGFGLSSLAGVGFDIGAAPTVIANGHAQIVYNTTTGSLYFDASGGDGHLIQLANLTGHPAVASSDFLLV